MKVEVERKPGNFRKQTGMFLNTSQNSERAIKLVKSKWN